MSLEDEILKKLLAQKHPNEKEEINKPDWKLRNDNPFQQDVQQVQDFCKYSTIFLIYFKYLPTS